MLGLMHDAYSITKLPGKESSALPYRQCLMSVIPTLFFFVCFARSCSPLLSLRVASDCLPLSPPFRLVTPVVGFLGNYESLQLRVSEHEISHVFCLSLADLCDPDKQTDDAIAGQRHGVQLRVFNAGPFPVWGLTCTEDFSRFPPFSLSLGSSPWSNSAPF